ncbi:hypothetical protein CRYUN_Cryun01aG0165700 [Craigia yunnanensis]
MERRVNYENDLNLKATELRLGLPGSDEPGRQPTPSIRNNKRTSSEISEESRSKSSSGVTQAGNDEHQDSAPPAKAQVVGWPPIRSSRKNCLETKKNEVEEAGMYVKVSVDGAPYLRKIDLKVYRNYPELLKALENMFKLTIGKNYKLLLFSLDKPMIKVWSLLLFFSASSKGFLSAIHRCILREGRLQWI